jgi:ATP:ADP antiporter, AAA family
VSESSDRRSILERFLSLFSEVRPGEGASTVLFLLNVFFVLVGYYVIKTVREPLILATGGAELKSYAAAAQAIALVFFVPAYSYVASRLSTPGCSRS